MPKSGLTIMRKLLKLISPFTLIMMITIAMGVLGFLAAIGITVFGAFGILATLDIPLLPFFTEMKAIYISLAIFAIMRGVLSKGNVVATRLLHIS